MSFRSVLSRLRRRTWIIIAVAVVVVAGASVWVFGFVVPSRGSSATEAGTRTITATAATRTMEKSVSASGTVTPAVQDDLSFAVSGRVTAVNVVAGATVAAGDVLATVDTLQVNADLLQAQADLAEANATLASAEDANDGTTAAKARVTADEAAVQVAQAAVTEAQAAVNETSLTAPAAGLITAVNVEVGDKVTASGSSGSAAFTLVSTDSWVANVTIGETDIANVQSGQSVTLTASGTSGLTGTVGEVGLLPSTTSGSAKYPVTIQVTGTGDGLYDGVSITAAIVYESREDVLAVPSAAVTTSNGVSTVILVEADGTQRKTTVTVGETADSYTEILTGLKAGDTVVVATFTAGTGGSGRTGTGGFPGGGAGGFPGGSFPSGAPGGGAGGFGGAGRGGTGGGTGGGTTGTGFTGQGTR